MPAVSDRFRKLATKARISTTRLHDARHTAITWFITEGVDLRTVMAIVGHSAASTTLTPYGHVVPETQVVTMRKIDERLAKRPARAEASDATAA
jgi:integrase